jgi:hypothetical protein
MNQASSPAPKTLRRQDVCTLYEGDYHYGVGALVNSLVRVGYKGTVWAGYRGSLPPWVSQLKPLQEPGQYMVAGQLRLAFIPLNVTFHFANYKPDFMLDLLANQASEADYLWYFDPDICIRCNWSFFEKWARHGVAICQDSTNNIVPENDPLCYQWLEMGEKEGLGKGRPLGHYFNSGMVGLEPAHKSFLELWKRMIAVGVAYGCDIQCITSLSRDQPFHILDQDAMVIAMMFTEHPLTTMAADAMGFVPGGYAMYHVRGPKPWRGSFLRRALGGTPPCSASKFYFTQVSSPIRLYSPSDFSFKKLACDLAAGIGRFYHRSR